MEKYRIIEFNMYGGLQGFGGFDIYVDNTNQPYAYVGFGESIQIKLNSNAHAIIICLSGKYGNSMEPAAIHIDANMDNHKYHCKIKRGWKKGSLEVIEDVRVMEENRKRHIQEQAQIKKVMDNREADSLFSSIEQLLMEQPVEEREYERLVSNDIPANLRFSDVYESRLKIFCKNEMEDAVLSFPDKHLVGIYLKGLSKISECEEAMKKLLVNEEVICDDIYRTQPVVSLDNDVFDEIQKIKERFDEQYKDKDADEIYADMWDILKNVTTRINSIDVYLKDKKYVDALRLIMFSDQDKDIVRYLMRYVPEAMIYLAVSDFKADTKYHVNDMLNACSEMYIRMCRKQPDGSMIHYPTINDIIANAYVYNKGGYIENINQQLEEYMESVGIFIQETLYKIDMAYFSDLFEILRKIFENFKAYDQEKMLLEGMYKYKIPRTVQQEQRLSFLKKGRSTAPEMLQVNSDSDTLFFDYRTIQWNVEKFNDYIENYTMQSRKIDIPMVVAEWNKSIQGYKIKWDINEIETALLECMRENFDNQYMLSVKKAGPITEAGGETEPAILVTENGNIKYPYIAYLVTGEKMTAKQINLAIYALLMPNLCADVSLPALEFNQKVLEKSKVVVGRQNPKLNNTIELMKTVIIEELEKWLQAHYSEESIYD